MIGVIIHLEDRWNYTYGDRDIDVLQMYKETVKGLGADVFILVDKTTGGIKGKFELVEIKSHVCKTLDEALSLYPNTARLYFEHTNAIGSKYISLDKFKHPKNALYIFGGDEKGLNFSEIKLRKEDKVINIDFTKYILWSIVAMTIALYDRHMKA